jgi:hypothetical protein
LIIEALASHRVLPWNGEEADALTAAADTVRASINQNGLDATRVNEAGNAVEDFVLDALRRAGFHAGRPVALSGRARVVGYPDLEATRDGVPFYVEVKTYGPATIDSTQRTFYLSPSGDFKVTHDAHHLLIAVELESNGAGHYHALAVRWLDLSRLRCDLKYEFNANNRDMYRSEAGLTIIDRGGEAGAASAAKDNAPAQPEADATGAPAGETSTPAAAENRARSPESGTAAESAASGPQS